MTAKKDGGDGGGGIGVCDYTAPNHHRTRSTTRASTTRETTATSGNIQKNLLERREKNVVQDESVVSNSISNSSEGRMCGSIQKRILLIPSSVDRRVSTSCRDSKNRLLAKFTCSWRWIGLLWLLTIIRGGHAGFACLSNPCIFGVCIDGLNSTYSCYCIDGYTGVQCQTNWDECWSAPCQNAGTCIDGVAYYNCSCPEGFTGTSCEENVNECLSNPCQNDGTCRDKDNGYICSCHPGYLGTHCEVDVAVCETGTGARCHNGGECLEGPGLLFTCSCPPGYQGRICQDEINECESSPCQNGGVCVDKLAAYVCACPMGYTGLNCEEEILICADSPCQNNALCLMEEGVPTCYCVPDYHGERCEFQYDECQLGPKCTNGGVCIDGVDTFTCSCPPMLTGLLCECLMLSNNNLDCNYTAPPRRAKPRPVLTTIQSTRTEDHYTTTQSPPSEDTTIVVVVTESVEVDATEEINSEETASTEDSDVTGEISSENLTTEPRFEQELTTPTPRALPPYPTTIYIPQITITSQPTYSTGPTIIQTTTVIPPYSYEATTYRTRYPIEVTRYPAAPPQTTLPPLQPMTTEIPTIDEVPTQPASSEEETLSKSPTTYRIPTHRYEPTEITTAGPPSPAEYSDYETETTTAADTEGGPPDHNIYEFTTTVTPFFTEYPEVIISPASTKYAPPGATVQTSKDVGRVTTYRPPPVSQTTITTTEVVEEYDEGAERSQPHEIRTTTTIPVSSYRPSQPSFRPTPPPFTFLPEHTSKSIFTDDLVTFAPTTITKEETTLLPPISPSPVATRPPLSPPTTISLPTSIATQGPPTVASVPENYTSTPADCTKMGCLSGGTCVTTSEGSRCVCRFDRQGSLCELPIIIKNAAFAGDSYVSHRIHKEIPHHDTLESVLPMHVQLKVRTRATNGLIMLAAAQGTKGGHYMALFLQKGLLQFQFSCGLQTMLLSELETPVNTGNEIVIRAELDFSRNFTHCNASLLVNDTLAMSGDQPTWLKLLSPRLHTADAIQNTWLHLGGAPQAPIGLIIELPPAQSGTGFTGCLHSLRINEEDRDIFGDALDGFGITECGSLACLSSPCRNGAACIKIDTDEMGENGQKVEKWKCKCPTGYMGPTCEISVCEDNPCQYGGTCVQFPGSGYLCLCPLGKHGHYCEHNLEVALPSFSGSVSGLSSFVAYTVPIPLEYSLELSFKILPQTMSQISLLAFLGQSGFHDEKSDHLAVSFIQGYIMLTWNLGGGPRRIFTQKAIDFRLDAPRVPYEIRVGRIGRQAWLSVDNKFNITGRSPGSVTRMDVMPILYLGGHEIANFNTLPHDLPLHSGFQGCIYDVHLKAGQVTVPLQETRGVRGRGVGQCGTRECHRHACQHDGACLQHGATFTCICQEGWYGPLCAQESNPCDSFNNKCSEDSTCVPLVNGYECDCPAGKTGKNCDEAIRSLSDVSLTGRRSFLAVRWPNLNNERSEKLGSKRSQMIQYRNFTKKTAPKPVSYSSTPGQHFVMKLLNEVEKQRSFTSSPLVTSTALDEHHRVQFFFIEFQVRPLSERGLLLYFGTLDNNQNRKIGFVSLSLQGGVVEFRISGPNNHVTVVRSVRMLAIGEWHKIKMAQRGRWLTLWVEGSASSALAPSAEVLVEPESLLYIGGLKDLSKLPHNSISGFPIPFRGCVRGLVVSGTRIVLNETNILESRNIRDCDGTACGGDSCESGGHCWLDEKLQPHCICPEYAKGDRCEYSETCKLIPCKNSGRCLRSGRCSCPNGWGGFYCEIAMSKPSTPNFRGNSYLVLPPPRIPVKDKRKGPSMYIRPRENMQISLNFSTIDSDGLLLWSSKDKNRFLGLGIEDGHIKIASNLLGNSNSTVDLPSGGFVADGGWHNVLISTDRNRIELTVDGQVVFTDRTNIVPDNFSRRGNNDPSISYEDLFYLGGFPNGESIASNTKNLFQKPFKGCLQDISFGSSDASAVITDFSQYEGENIGSCELHDEDLIIV